jgi:hypothetical protein
MLLPSMTTEQQRVYFLNELREVRAEIATCYKEGLTSAADALTDDEVFLCQCLFDLDN